jgi:hypothetical protein
MTKNGLMTVMQMAGAKVPASQIEQRRLLLLTSFKYLRTAGAKVTAGRRIDGAGYLAF